ncbi:unnamed protein product, partial [Mesorhabditis belari]|uniref:Uncharacterized protein n=1 Tax=Mesorhabditis belari TaxID=2138241 RepID=A0AAF3FCD7_9BILA
MKFLLLLAFLGFGLVSAEARPKSCSIFHAAYCTPDQFCYLPPEKCEVDNKLCVGYCKKRDEPTSAPKKSKRHLKDYRKCKEDDDCLSGWKCKPPVNYCVWCLGHCIEK